MRGIITRNIVFLPYKLDNCPNHYFLKSFNCRLAFLLNVTEAPP